MKDLFNIDFTKLSSFFVFDKNDPLIFTTSLFLFFFLGLLILYRISSRIKVLRTLVLVLFSFFFYYKVSGIGIVVLFGSVILNYIIGIGIEKSSKYRTIVFIAGLVFNVLLLFYFKYTNFFIQIYNSINNTQVSPLALILPIGLSFYTFKAISYLIEVNWGTMPAERNFIDFTLYLAFFANITAGPIDRPDSFIPQIKSKYFLSKEDLGKAIYLICLGLIKKIVIADFISLNFVDRVFLEPLKFTGVENLLASYAYSLQIFCDFSGYTDIALGTSLLLGFKLMPNFNFPYKADSIADFWRRWHISLSFWLQLYLFKPMQISLRSWGVYSNIFSIFITFLICGFWHGAGYTFIIWGGIHGLFLAVGMLLKNPKEKLYKRLGIINSPLLKVLKVFVTFNLITFAWVIFRSSTLENAFLMFDQILHFFKAGVLPQFIVGFPIISVLIFMGFLLHYMPSKWELKIQQFFISVPLPVKGLVLAFVIYFASQFKLAGLQPFLYFQF